MWYVVVCISNERFQCVAAGWNTSLNACGSDSQLEVSILFTAHQPPYFSSSFFRGPLRPASSHWPIWHSFTFISVVSQYQERCSTSKLRSLSFVLRLTTNALAFPALEDFTPTTCKPKTTLYHTWWPRSSVTTSVKTLLFKVLNSRS